MLVIQDPTNAQSTYLLESLLDAFHSAEKVAAAFAFASSSGVRLFTEDDAFKNVARRHPVNLIVGVDAVTNVKALDSLAAVSTSFPNVQVRVFVNPRRGALFHPKVCWTRNSKGGHLIIGSGNLTEGGLLRNWEAYSVEQLDSKSIDAVEAAWSSWTATHHGSLLPLDNADVRRLANANNIMAPEGDFPTLVAPATTPLSAAEPDTVQLIADAATVLVAEIPQSGDRWKQVNFHLDDYLEFFGAEKGRLVVFRHVNADGTLAEYERARPPVTVKSRNFRFELAAASGKEYPAPPLGRPIGIYVRVATRTFYYRLLLPDDAQYGVVSAMIQRRVGPATPKKMRTVRVTAADLRRDWPSAPFWNLPLTS